MAFADEYVGARGDLDQVVGPGRIARDGEVLSAIVVDTTRQIGVFAAGEAVTFDVHDSLAENEEAGAGEDRLIAPMPGLAKVVSATAGAKVTRGEPLVVLEAMKMEHTLVAPRDGEIAEVLVAAGEQVQDGTVLVRLVEEKAG